MISLLLLALILAVSRSTAKSTTSEGNVAGSVNITKYYETKEVSWTYNTTKRTTYSCVGDRTNNITEKSVVYIRHSMDGATKSPVNETLTGEFVHDSDHHKAQARDRGGPYNAMNVYEDGELWWKERLDYMSADGNCGVFTVEIYSGRRTRKSYDLRLKGSAAETGPDQNCVNKFNLLRKNATVTTLYTSDCKLKAPRSIDTFIRLE